MRKILKAAVVLTIAILMVFSTVAIADTQDKQSRIIFTTNHEDSAIVARGDIVWDNDMSYLGLIRAQYDSSIPLDCYPADDFHFEEDTVVCDVHWVGGYWFGNYQQGDFDWVIKFYKDRGDGNAPGVEYAGPFTYTWDQITKVFLQDTGTMILYELSVDLPESILFNGCEKYWISIWGIGFEPPNSGLGFHYDPIILHKAMVKSFYFFEDNEWHGAEELSYEPSDLCFQLTTMECNPGIDVEKHVWDDKNQEWTDADTESTALDAPICSEVKFKIVIHNNGDCPLFNIHITDVMHDSLKYISADPEPDEFQYNPPYYNMFWLYPGPLMPCETNEIYITAHVEGPECSTDFNYVEVFGTCEHGTIVRDQDYCYVHAIKQSREFNRPFINWLQSHPNLFPILQKLIQQLGFGL